MMPLNVPSLLILLFLLDVPELNLLLTTDYIIPPRYRGLLYIHRWSALFSI